MKNSNYRDMLLGDIVAEDFRSAAIFTKAGLDFCCGGKKSLREACNEKSLDINEIIQSLEELETLPPAPGQNFSDWSPDFLADYIVNTHHKFVLKNLPDLVYYTEKLAGVHGSNHPELVEIRDLFARVNEELLQHLRNEEEVLFPAIKEVMSTGSESKRATIASEIGRMHGEHEFAGGAMDKINEMTKGYAVPADGCNTYHAGFKLLHQFEDDLHIHVHLENNILFPKSLKL